MAQPSEFGRRLREVRTTAGIAASGLSLAAGVSRDVVRQLEEGLIVNPSVDTARAIAETLGISLEWLATGNGDAPGVQELERALDRVRNANMRTRGADEPIPFTLASKVGS